ncbi:UNVERIFIED_CONTAM: hypothetical protein Scaly_3039900 [Sesamum calycinum]|uniref:Multiple inositol polyphosphate phosphatase 1 n=1 Tax=Sesamum calycinum TaxID=2727403 RepID=A0AAW2K7I4_9LAMI
MNVTTPMKSSLGGCIFLVAEWWNGSTVSFGIGLGPSVLVSSCQCSCPTAYLNSRGKKIRNHLEASLLNKTDQACALFTPSEMIWRSFVLKGYGNSLNYRMGVPLLEDVIQSMEQAINAKEDGLVSGSYEMARLRFAHAETLLPFSCLIGLFLDGPGEFLHSLMPSVALLVPSAVLFHGSYLWVYPKTVSA